jgi:hypothetical protein
MTLLSILATGRSEQIAFALVERLLCADSVEKVFLGRRTKFSRTADAFRTRRPEGAMEPAALDGRGFLGPGSIKAAL